ncbi:MAG: L-histidine N(alpha)-methyltransferase, partial [Bacteroidales bacterium]|nr:L-histidine N(alpha)-methyltransferase [Bacteroidales bacterium]
SDALSGLVDQLESEIPRLMVKARAGDYFRILKDLYLENNSRKVILFLGSNIGNFLPEQLDDFLKTLSDITSTGDMVLIGFDLKKSPSVLRDAYDDSHGFTKEFNINHLVRINHELGADFNTENFIHHAIYNPSTGAMESYLMSTCNQSVYVEAFDRTINFSAWESIFMELSRKFSLEEIDQLAVKYGFDKVENFLDDKKYFADCLWVRK